jgi:hypothetical protein
VGIRELQFSCEWLLLEAGSWGTEIFQEPTVGGTSAVGSHYQAMASEDCNRLSTSLCVTMICEV